MSTASVSPLAPPSFRSAIDELAIFVDSSAEMRAFFDHTQTANDGSVHVSYDNLKPVFKKFLSATMDQVRVNRALECTGHILKVADLEDLEMFREGVWKREATGVINFPGQRDHTAHTLNNWLLGWYVYSKSVPIRTAIGTAVANRKWKAGSFDSTKFFGLAWLFTSLLHDIGYLFEGSLGTMETGFQSSQATIGLRVTDEYFHFGFWRHMKLTSADDRKLAESERQRIPVAPGEPSLSRIALYLRTLGDVDELAIQLKATAQRPDGPTIPADLPGDAFELWKLHFQSFKQDLAATRIADLETAFIDHVVKGMPGLGLRVLDHGVCSGLVQLKISTFFYQLFASLQQKADALDPAIANAAAKIIKREGDVAHPYDYEFWWSGVVWATASAALHNMQQREGDWCEGVKPGPLKLDEEPLTYLGVLVDCLQDWDRYFVFDSSARSPIQGVDVRLGYHADKIVVVLPATAKKQLKKIRGDLDCALEGWEAFVDLGCEAS